VKRRRSKVELTERQELILAIVLVILVAVSVLYCLGFASLALRHVWENQPLPWAETNPLAPSTVPAPAQVDPSPTIPP
jgi:hypothetical protein